MRLQLVRFGYLRDCTLGWLYVGSLRLATIEEPWIEDPDGPGGQRLEGALPASCVPDGTYVLDPHQGAFWKDVWALVNPRLGVWHWPSEIPKAQPWGRSAVLIHTGNSTKNIEGCIAIGLLHTIVGGQHWVSESQKAMFEFRKAMMSALVSEERHQLIVRPTAGTAEAA